MAIQYMPKRTPSIHLVIQYDLQPEAVQESHALASVLFPHKSFLAPPMIPPTSLAVECYLREASLIVLSLSRSL